MDASVEILIGITIGVLAGWRIIRPIPAVLLVVGAVIAIFGFVIFEAIRNGEIKNFGTFVAVAFLYAPGVVCYVLGPAGASAGVMLALSHAKKSDKKERQPIARKLKCTILGAICLGVLYLIGETYLLLSSRGVEGNIAIQTADLNEPVLWFMVMFGLSDIGQKVPWQQATCITVTGTFLYAFLGGMAGFIIDLMKPQSQLPPVITAGSGDVTPPPIIPTDDPEKSTGF